MKTREIKVCSGCGEPWHVVGKRRPVWAKDGAGVPGCQCSWQGMRLWKAVAKMDPHATLEAWAKALVEYDDETAVEMAEALLGWLGRGGFKPFVDQHSESAFVGWCDAHDIKPT